MEPKPMPETQGVASWTNAETSVPELQLIDQLRRSEGTRGGLLAVHLHLARLRPHFHNRNHLRIAQRTFDPLLLTHDAQLFPMSDGDMILIGRNVPVGDIDDIIAKICLLFQGDPLIENPDNPGEELATWYDLERDYNLLLGEVSYRAKQAKIAGARPFKDLPLQRELHGKQLDPLGLENVCRGVERIGFTDLIRQQSAIQVGPGGQGRILFREHYVAINELRKQVAPGIDLLSNPWLFQKLTELLDRRVLAILGHRDFNGLRRAISLNLNVRTVLDTQFEAFDRLVGDNAEKLVIELQTADLFADMAAYEHVRDRLQARGYRVLIDGLTPLSLQFFDPGLLGADLYKIHWGERYADKVSAEDRKDIHRLIGSIRREKMLMARVDSESGIEFGLSLGISRFQGRFIDRLIAAMAGRATGARGRAKP